MIKFEKTEVMGMEAALRGMRNPLNSWHRADSGWLWEKVAIEESDTESLGDIEGLTFEIGPNDMDLAKRLIKSGPDDRKFLRQIFVSVDITAPLYWWKEFDKYQIGVTTNSCSTMHKIHAKEFTRDDFSCEHLDSQSLAVLDIVIQALNLNRDFFNRNKNKDDWWQMIQLLPSSFNQKRTVTLNYEVLRNIARARKGHKLDEWRVGVMGWIKSLPYAEDLIIN
jgi:hypothetical protein